MFPGLAFSLSQTENHVFSFIHQHRDFGCRHAMEDVKMFSFEISDDKKKIMVIASMFGRDMPVELGSDEVTLLEG